MIGTLHLTDSQAGVLRAMPPFGARPRAFPKATAREDLDALVALGLATVEDGPPAAGKAAGRKLYAMTAEGARLRERITPPTETAEKPPAPAVALANPNLNGTRLWHLRPEEIEEDPENVRRVPPSAAADEALRASIAASGILQPLLVRKAEDGRWIARDGHRRRRAALALSLPLVPAVEIAEDLTDLEVQTVANTVRENLQPVDQWRAMAALMGDGKTRDHAAQVLGLTDRQARRLAKLGAMHEDMLTLVERHGLPLDKQLPIIAMAPPEVQASAAAKFLNGWDRPWAVAWWWQITQACEIVRIPESRAIFDPSWGDVVFEEDLFADLVEQAEEDPAARRFTTNRKGFLAAQEGALRRRAESGDRPVTVLDLRAGQPVIPDGYVRSDEPVDAPKLAKNRRVFAWIETGGPNLGAVVEAVFKPAGKETREAGTSAPSRDDAAFATATAAGAARPRPPLTSVGINLLREARCAGLRAAIRRQEETPATALRLLLTVLTRLCLYDEAGDGEDSPEWDTEALLEDLVAGNTLLRPSDAGLARLGLETAARLVDFPGAWPGLNVLCLLARSLDAGANLPRLDTAEFLATLRDDVVVGIGKGIGLECGGDAAELRRRLEGTVPDLAVMLPGGAWPLRIGSACLGDGERDDDPADEVADEGEGEE